MTKLVYFFMAFQTPFLGHFRAIWGPFSHETKMCKIAYFKSHFRPFLGHFRAILGFFGGVIFKAISDTFSVILEPFLRALGLIWTRPKNEQNRPLCMCLHEAILDPYSLILGPFWALLSNYETQMSKTDHCAICDFFMACLFFGKFWRVVAKCIYIYLVDYFAYLL